MCNSSTCRHFKNRRGIKINATPRIFQMALKGDTICGLLLLICCCFSLMPSITFGQAVEEEKDYKHETEVHSQTQVRQSKNQIQKNDLENDS